MKPHLLDLFCKAGGCTKGYQRAGFYVTGVDIEPQPNYCGDAFVQADAFWLAKDSPMWLRRFDAIHASPPCQAFSPITVVRGCSTDHPDLIEPTRELLDVTGLPYVIENVPGSPLKPTIVLCGSMFGLGVRRHRLFESTAPMLQPECQHRIAGVPMGVYGHPGGGESSRRKNKGKKGSAAEWAAAMGIDWMTARELAQAIPPAYTEHIGGYLMAEIKATAAA